MAPDTRGVVREQMDGDRRRVRDRADVVNVVSRRQQRVELAAAELLTLRDLEPRARWIAAIVEAAVDRFVLPAAIDSDQSPREMVVHRRRRTDRDDQREQASDPSSAR